MWTLLERVGDAFAQLVEDSTRLVSYRARQVLRRAAIAVFGGGTMLIAVLALTVAAFFAFADMGELANAAFYSGLITLGLGAVLVIVSQAWG